MNFFHRPAKTVHPRGEAARIQPSYSIPGPLGKQLAGAAQGTCSGLWDVAEDSD